MASRFSTVPFENTIELEDPRDLGEFGIWGKATIAPRPEIPAYATFQHLIAVGKLGSAPGDFHWPRGVSIQEDTARIYVADSGNRRIQIFSKNGKQLNEFGDKHLSCPWGIVTHEDSVFVTDCGHHAVFKFELQDHHKENTSGAPHPPSSVGLLKKGGGHDLPSDNVAHSYFKMVKRIGEVGSGNEKFNSPRQLAVSPTQRLYVTDQCNNRVQILSCNLVFQGLLHHQSMTNPVDVKFSADQVFVLSCLDDPCVHTFTFSGEKIRSIISRGFKRQVRGASFFCMDADNNFIICDALAYDVKVFTPEGDLLHTFGGYGLRPGKFYKPQGVSILQQTHLVCIDYKANSGLLIFSEFS